MVATFNRSYVINAIKRQRYCGSGIINILWKLTRCRLFSKCGEHTCTNHTVMSPLIIMTSNDSRLIYAGYDTLADTGARRRYNYPSIFCQQKTPRWRQNTCTHPLSDNINYSHLTVGGWATYRHLRIYARARTAVIAAGDHSPQFIKDVLVKEHLNSFTQILNNPASGLSL